MRPRPENWKRGARGFTLLEMILAMFVLVLLVGGIFAIVGGTTQLADEMERAHERDARRHSFAQFCERMLRSLPGSAQIRLKLKQEGNHYLSELALKDGGAPFGAGGANGLTVLRSEQMPDGYLRVVLELFTREEAGAREIGKGDGAKQRLVLLEGVSRCEWKFFNSQSGEWESVWNEKLSFADLASVAAAPPAPAPGGARPPDLPLNLALTPPGQPAQRPGLVELNLALGADAPQRYVFWVPPASRPGATGVTTAPGASQPPPDAAGNPQLPPVSAPTPVK